jgi:hypothetical protein
MTGITWSEENAHHISLVATANFYEFFEFFMIASQAISICLHQIMVLFINIIIIIIDKTTLS